MPPERLLVALFYSTSLAIRAERVARTTGCRVKLIPTPRHLSSDCGTALRFKYEDQEKIIEAFSARKIEFDRIAEL